MLVTEDLKLLICNGKLSSVAQGFLRIVLPPLSAVMKI